MSIEAMKLALFALDIVKIHYTQNRHINEAIAALKERLAQPEQEPIGYLSEGGAERLFAKKQAHEQIKNFRLFAHDVPVYAHPPQRTEQETDELQSLRQFRDAAFLAHPNIDLDIEAAHGIKEDT